MSAFTATGRPVSNTPPPGPAVGGAGAIAQPSGFVQPPLQAPYPSTGGEHQASSMYGGSSAVANRHPGAAGHNFHLTPMGQQQYPQLANNSNSNASTPLPQLPSSLLQPPSASSSSAPPLGITGNSHNNFSNSRSNSQPNANTAAAAASGGGNYSNSTPSAASGNPYSFTSVPQQQQQQQPQGNYSSGYPSVASASTGQPPLAPSASSQAPPSSAPAAGTATPGQVDAMRDHVAQLRAQLAAQQQAASQPRRNSGSQPSAAAAAAASAQKPLSVSATAAPTSGRRPSSATTKPAAASTTSAAAKRPTTSSAVHSPGSTTRGRSSTGGSPKRGKQSMAQRVVALREEVKENEEKITGLETELNHTKETLTNTAGELDITKQILSATDNNLRDLTQRHGELTNEHNETNRQLQSSNQHGETLEAQVGVFRRGKELEHAEDRLFGYFLHHCLCPACIGVASVEGAIPHVPGEVPEQHARTAIGLLASTEENPFHCAENSGPIKCGEKEHQLRIPHEVASLVSKNFEELSGRADAQRAQIAALNDQVKNRNDEIERLNTTNKALQESLDLLRAQHRANENTLLIETAEKAAALVKCDDAVRNVHLLKAALRQTLDENDNIAKELDKQLTRIQVIDANEAMHNNRHDDAANTIEMRTKEIGQLRDVIGTMESNHENLSNENYALRQAAQKLQEQIGKMKSNFDDLSADVSQRLQAQAQRVTQIEDYTMKLATTAVQAQMAEQEASKQAQALIDKMRTEGNETQKAAAHAVEEAHSIPVVFLPQAVQCVRPQFVPTSIPPPEEEETSNGNQQQRGGRNNSPKREVEAKHGPNSPAGRLGTALAESQAYAQSPTRNHYGDAATAAAGGGAGKDAQPSSRTEDQKLASLLSPVGFGTKRGEGAGGVQEEQRALDPAEALARQIRATLAVDQEARGAVEAAIEHANATIGRE